MFNMHLRDVNPSLSIFEENFNSIKILNLENILILDEEIDLIKKITNFTNVILNLLNFTNLIELQIIYTI